MAGKYGLFSQPEHLPEAQPAPPSKDAAQDSRPALKAGFSSKTGKLNDATFSPYVSLHAGDAFQDAGTELASKLAAKEAGQKPEPRPFKPASPAKRPTAPHAGELHGTISTRFDYIPSPPQPADGGRSQQPALQHKPIYTSPAKQGSYGFNGVTLSQRAGPGGVVGEYAHQPDPWVSPSDARKAQDAAAHVPFKPPAARAGAFGRYEHIPAGWQEPVKGARQVSTFKPGYCGSSRAFGNYPQHIPSPPADSKAAAGSEEAPNKRGAFRPASGFRETATPSPLKMSLRLRR